MSNVDAELDRLRREWRTRARYRVIVAHWVGGVRKDVLATALDYEAASKLADDEAALRRAAAGRGVRFGDPVVSFELERRSPEDESFAAIRSVVVAPREDSPESS